MPKRNLAWIVLIFLVVVLFWTLPGTLAGRDSLYRAFGPLVTVRAMIQKYHVDEPTDEALLDGAIRGMISELDPFSSYISAEDYQEFRDRQTEGVFNGVGIEVDLQDGMPTVISPIDGTPAFYSDVIGGDQILSVDGEPTHGKPLMDVVSSITGTPGTSVTLTLRTPPDGDPRDIELQRTRIQIQSVKGFSRDADGHWAHLIADEPEIGYVRVSTFVENTVPQLRSALRELQSEGARAIILDLRFNPGGLLNSAIDMVDCFVDNGPIVMTRGRRIEPRSWSANPETACPDWPMVVLINGESASASEIVSGALQANERAVIVGTRSYGKGSVQNMLELDGGGALKLTTAYYYVAGDRPIHRFKDSETWGVEPDIVISMTPEEREKVYRGRQRAEVIPGRRAEVQGEPAAETEITGVPIDPQLAAGIDRIRVELASQGIASETVGSRAK